MQCPFLHETVVDSCRHSLVRKLVVRNPENLSLERCSSQAYEQCPIYASAPDPGGTGQCPFLDESLVQYCSAAPVPKFIPFSEALLSRCGSASFHYCDLYISMAHPDDSDVPRVDGIAVPEWLHYAQNHMWLDVSEDGVLHVGIDGLLSRVLGEVDRITYLTPRGVAPPAVTLGAGDKDYHLVFPHRLMIQGTNTYLRANPSKLTADPYRWGWLFECRVAPGECVDVTAGLHRGGEDAVGWMQSELDRMSLFVHEFAGSADGGQFTPGVVRYLDRDQSARFYHEFFSR